MTDSDLCPNCAHEITNRGYASENFGTLGRVLYECLCSNCDHDIFAIHCKMLNEITWRSRGPSYRPPEFAQTLFVPFAHNIQEKYSQSRIEANLESSKTRVPNKLTVFVEDLPKRRVPTLIERLSYGFQLLSDDDTR